MRGSRNKTQQHGGERTLLYKKEILSILNSLVTFAVCLDPCMSMSFLFLHQHQNIPTLIILDMMGNPLVQECKNYRLFLVYHLQALKALDGIPVVSPSYKQTKKNKQWNPVEVVSSLYVA